MTRRETYQKRDKTSAYYDVPKDIDSLARGEEAAAQLTDSHKGDLEKELEGKVDFCFRKNAALQILTKKHGGRN